MKTFQNHLSIKNSRYTFLGLDISRRRNVAHCNEKMRPQHLSPIHAIFLQLLFPPQQFLKLWEAVNSQVNQRLSRLFRTFCYVRGLVGHFLVSMHNW